MAIKSVSGLSEFRNDLFDMVDHVFAVSCTDRKHLSGFASCMNSMLQRF